MTTDTQPKATNNQPLAHTQTVPFDRPSEIPGVLPSAASRLVQRVRTLPEVPRGEAFQPQWVYFEDAYWVALPDGSWARLSTIK